MTRNTKVETVAYHEAGHAVAARLLGVAINYVALFPTDDTNQANVRTHSAAWRAREADAASVSRALEADAKVSLAGPHAQLRLLPHTNVARARRYEWGSDLEDATSAIAKVVLLKANPHQRFDSSCQVTLSPEDAAEAIRIWERLDAETKALVTENWSAIERVATALLKHHILHGDEIDVLIASLSPRAENELGPTWVQA